MSHPAECLEDIAAIARRAGEAILGCAQVRESMELKADKTPVTEADKAANALIVEALMLRWPHIPVVSEEEPDSHAIAAPSFFLVDPLDGTKGFLNGEDEYTVNIGLIENGRPVLGAIFLPARGTLYYGAGGRAYRTTGSGAPAAIRGRTAPEEGYSAVVSKYHPSKRLTAFLADYPITATVPASSSYKFCLVAEGSADFYPRLGTTKEWDTAAGHAIVEAAGGRVTTLDGAPLAYGKPGFENPGFLAWGKNFNFA